MQFPNSVSNACNGMEGRGGAPLGVNHQIVKSIG